MRVSPLLRGALFSFFCGAASLPAAPPKVIIDTDFNTIGDDGQVAIMAAQLFAEGKIDLLGFTVASGNAWRDQQVAECLRAVERLGLQDRLRVHVGALYPILHDYKSYLDEVARFGPATDYVGAYASAEPKVLQEPPGGFAQIHPGRLDAVDYIIRTVHRFPHEVTILEVAPPTDLALALRKDPTIEPLIKEIVTMSGQIFVAGNSYRDAGEFNWWFDPEATKVVLRAAIPHVIIPLDCTNTVPVTKEVYERIAHPKDRPETVITELFRDTFAPFFGAQPPPYPLYIYDTLALAYLVRPDLVTRAENLWVDMHTDFDPLYGKSIVYRADPSPSIGLLQESKVVFRIDNARFYDFYVDLLTRAVPVRFHSDGCREATP